MSDHRNVVAFALVLVAALGCKGKDGPEAQSFREGMEIICAAGAEEELQHANPAERQAEIADWIHARLRNPEAIALFATLAEAAPAERGKALSDAAKRAGLDGCALVPPDPFSSIALPEVGDARLESLEPQALLIATRNAIVVEGEEIVALNGGRVDPSELDGGSAGLRIPRLARYLEALAQATDDQARRRAAPPGPRALMVAVDPTTSYDLFFQVLSTAKESFPGLAVVARGRSGVGAIPITVPAADAIAPPPSAPSAEPEEVRLELAISVTATELSVWSMSGLEGTMQQPVLTAPIADLAAATTAMQQKLTEIASRRQGESSLVIMADGKVPMATVALVMAMARRAPDGSPLFVDLMLGTGFE